LDFGLFISISNPKSSKFPLFSNLKKMPKTAPRVLRVVYLDLVIPEGLACPEQREGNLQPCPDWRSHAGVHPACSWRG